jgi:serine/threonine-protein kinase
MADRDALATTLQQLRDRAVDVTQRDVRSTLEPPRRADTAGQRALKILSQLSPPTERGALELERTLGTGGMGVVHLGTQVALGRKVAVKTLRPEHRTDETAMQLLREGWVIGALEHPNVVPIHDLGLDADGHPFLVLKRIEGDKWDDLLGDDEKVRERFGAADLLEWNLSILMQVCNAMSFAHARGILHRDLKPENVMIGEFGEVYLLDWGLAVSLRDDGSGRLPLAADEHDVCGTPSYMAPEMLDGHARRLSERTDVYLLGAALFEILTGRAPHEGTTIADVIANALRSQPTFPEGVSPELERICRRALAADPDARFENAQQLRLALQGFLQRRGSAQLAQAAQARLEKLLVELAAPSAEPAARRVALYNVFGECRFGFQQALRSWRENPPAQEGLLRATEAMIAYELQQGDAKAASLLASGLASPPPELLARIAEAERAAEIARERERELERIGREWDPNVGRRTRAFLSVVAGVMWTVIPLLSSHRLFYESYTGLMAAPAGMLVFALLLTVWARESMTKTAINRALVGSAMFNMAAMMVLHGGATLLGMPTRMIQALDLFVWMCVTGLMAITIDRRLAVGTAGYFVGFFVACLRPPWVFYVMSATNALLTVTMLRVWGRGLTLSRRP